MGQNSEKRHHRKIPYSLRIQRKNYPGNEKIRLKIRKNCPQGQIYTRCEFNAYIHDLREYFRTNLVKPKSQEP